MCQDVRREEVVEKRTPFDESSLEGVNEHLKEPLQPRRQNLRDDFRQPVNQTDRPEVPHICYHGFFRDKANPTAVELLKVQSSAMQVVKDLQ